MAKREGSDAVGGEEGVDGAANLLRAPLLGSSRLSFTICAFFGCISLYLMRINMGVAIVCMTRDPVENDTDINTTDQGYPRDFRHRGLYRESDCNVDAVIDDSNQGEFEWNRELRGYVNSSFFVGYLLTQVLGGWLAAKFGGKRVLGVGIFITSVASLLSPVAARGSVYLLMAMRVIKGLASGVYFPALHQMWSVWAPFYERSTLVASASSGNAWGSILSFFLSGVLCDAIGWDWIFYIYGITALVWLVFWGIFAFDSPSQHPRISQKEHEYLQRSIPARPKDQEELHTPWVELMTSPRVWAIVMGDFCYLWGTYTSLTSMPQYMSDVLKFDIKTNGFYNSLPYIAQFVGTFIVSIFIDTLRVKKYVSTTVARKIAAVLTCVPPACLLVGVAYLDCHKAHTAVAMLCLVEFFASAARSSFLPNKVDIAPRYAGVIMGVANTAGTIPGIVAPIVTGHLTPNGTQSEWQTVFFISAGIYLFGAVFYLVLGSGEIQSWGRLTDDTFIAPQVEEVTLGGENDISIQRAKATLDSTGKGGDDQHTGLGHRNHGFQLEVNTMDTIL